MKQERLSQSSRFRILHDGWTYLTTRYLVVSSLPLLVAHAITAVLGLTRNALLTNCLTKDDFGVLNYVMSWLAVVAVLGMPGLNLAVAQYVARGHWEAVRLGLRRRLVLSVLPMVTLAAIGWIGSKAGRTDIAPSVWLLTALFFPSAQVLTAIGSVLGALRRFRKIAILYVGQSAAFLLAVGMGLSLWRGPATEGIVLFQWLLVSVVNGWFWAHLRRPEVDPVPLSPAQRKQFYRFGAHLTAMDAITQARDRISALLLGGLVSLSALADYSIGNLFFEQMKSLWGIYYGVSYPRLLTLDAQDRWRQVRREALLACPAFAALAGLVGIGLAAVVPWLFSAKYGSSLGHVWILLLAFVCSVPGGFFEMYFRVEEAEKALYQIRLAAAVFGILLPPLLLALWGPLGVAAGRTGANVVYSIVGFVLYRRQKT